ncbi:uncharacterized protein SPPG_06836 [Spizellomyces punctatus DAOM BR117]|uniref:Uncharacterized protein n=1 Tax=Spizellomyces punctatus (strain DAOM BR117) TaxID=645134 RepID=A0A0L0H8I2_SPIPD|nr:uncharacterized protein SPPG_06836 [Spizellomyces punctatus DAOM BR117]KNC97840.1 hypothetical protein SPPG_06836 [Spizellomyces punctatus DAOM BR117]|eukprot:XP_016605880.1 hypothetical protein SPPG_06836 [Spizellomyces punctatus DAOM BR117]
MAQQVCGTVMNRTWTSFRRLSQISLSICKMLQVSQISSPPPTRIPYPNPRVPPPPVPTPLILDAYITDKRVDDEGLLDRYLELADPIVDERVVGWLNTKGTLERLVRRSMTDKRAVDVLCKVDVNVLSGWLVVRILRVMWAEFEGDEEFMYFRKLFLYLLRHDRTVGDWTLHGTPSPMSILVRHAHDANIADCFLSIVFETDANRLQACRTYITQLSEMFDTDDQTLDGIADLLLRVVDEAAGNPFGYMLFTGFNARFLLERVMERRPECVRVLCGLVMNSVKREGCPPLCPDILPIVLQHVGELGRVVDEIIRSGRKETTTVLYILDILGTLVRWAAVDDLQELQSVPWCLLVEAVFGRYRECDLYFGRVVRLLEGIVARECEEWVEDVIRMLDKGNDGQRKILQQILKV